MNRDNTPKGFLIYYDNEIVIYRLSDDEAGKLFKSLFPYAKESIKPDFSSSPALAMAFDILSMAIDRNKELYKKRCEINRKNVQKRWNKESANVYERTQSNTDVYEQYQYKDKEKEKEKDKNKEKDIINYQLIADMYNDTCVSFPRVTKISESRKKAMRARLKTYSVEDFRKVFEMAEGSSFLKGQNNRNWSATFDWMMKDSNFAKILDGNYQDNGVNKPVYEETPAEKRERERQANLAQWDEEQKNRTFHVPPVAPEDAAF